MTRYLGLDLGSVTCGLSCRDSSQEQSRQFVLRLMITIWP